MNAGDVCPTDKDRSRTTSTQLLGVMNRWFREVQIELLRQDDGTQCDDLGFLQTVRIATLLMRGPVFIRVRLLKRVAFPESYVGGRHHHHVPYSSEAASNVLASLWGRLEWMTGRRPLPKRVARIGYDFKHDFQT
jgi:hypothetical protein